MILMTSVGGWLRYIVRLGEGIFDGDSGGKKRTRAMRLDNVMLEIGIKTRFIVSLHRLGPKSLNMIFWYLA